jgi:tetratricopeptide (TPR) repeat protein
VLDRENFTQAAAFEESGTLEELSSLEAHLSWRVLKLVAPGTAPAESNYLSLRRPVRLDAEESYIRGLLATQAEQQEMFFMQAARLDSRDWRPAFEIGKILMARKAYREAAPWLEQVRPTDARYAEAGFLLGVAKFHANDIVAAEEVFERLSQTVPLGGVFNNLGAAQSRNGKSAAAAFRAALRDDPNNPNYHFNLGYALWKAGEFESAIESFHAALDRNPSDTMATLLLGRSLTKQGPRKANPADARLLALERIEESFADLGYRRPGGAVE